MLARKPFLVWFFANMAGFVAVTAAFLALTWLASRAAQAGSPPGAQPRAGISGVAAFGFVVAIPLALIQWLALRRIVPVSPLWVLTIPAGLLMAALIFRAIPERLWEILDGESTPVLSALFAILGLAVGLPQWLLLRRSYPHAFVWPVASAAGVAGGFAFVLASGLINASEVLSYVVVVVVYSCVTGLILAWLQGQSSATSGALLEGA
jgi:hypothetical protein